MSPELLDPERFDLEHCRPTEPSDCYALGMVVYEVLSGNLPFHRHGRYAVVARVLEGERPERPRGAEGAWFNDDIWSVLERCWNPTPSGRPKSMDVLIFLEKVSASWSPPQTMNSDSSAKDSTEKDEAAPAESLCGSPPVRKPSIVPGNVGARKRQKVDIEAWEPCNRVVPQGVAGKVRSFFWPENVSLKPSQAFSGDSGVEDRLQRPSEPLYKSHMNRLHVEILQFSFFFFKLINKIPQCSGGPVHTQLVGSPRVITTSELVGL